MLRTSNAIAADRTAEADCATFQGRALMNAVAADAPWLSKQQVRELTQQHMALDAQIKSLDVLRDAIVLVGVLGIAFGLCVQLY